jgi:hypothetical protein
MEGLLNNLMRQIQESEKTTLDHCVITSKYDVLSSTVILPLRIQVDRKVGST